MIDAERWREWFDSPGPDRPSSLRAPGCRGVYLAGPPLFGEPTLVFAWIGMPDSAPDRLPGVVLVHGGGGTADAAWVRQWTARGYAAIAVDTSGQVPIGTYGDWRRNPAGGPPGWGGFDHIARPDVDQWGFHAVAAVVSAVSFLTAVPAVDPDRIALIGISWGGHLACLVAGIDPRPACIASIYGAGFADRSPMFAADMVDMGEDDRQQWLSRWDPRWYLPQARAPMLFASGTNDTAWDVTALSDSAALVPAATLSIRPGLPHDHLTGTSVPECEPFLDHHLRSGPALPGLTAAALTHRPGAGISVTAGVTPAVAAEGPATLTGWLCTTVDSGSWIDRRWRTAPAEFAGVTLSAPLPPATTAALLAVQDDRGCWMSTSVLVT